MSGGAVTMRNAEALPQWPAKPERLSLDEQALRRGIRPIMSVDELVESGMFDSDEELADFLADLHASRSGTVGPIRLVAASQASLAAGHATQDELRG